MQLTVPTVWDDSLLDALSGLKGLTFYAKLKEDAVGGCREARRLPQVSRARAAAHIRRLHAAGWKFQYVLNGACLGNAEYTPAGRRKILALVDWVAGAGADSVVVTLPFLIEWIKRRHPRLKVSVSLLSGVDSIAMARLYAGLGADELNVPQNFNRDFAFLRALRRHAGLPLKLLANSSCLYGCAFRRYHTVVSTHASQTGRHGRDCEYSALQCTMRRFEDPAEIVRSPWIRPEDLKVYERLGIDRFKLSSRTNTAAWLAATARAYAARKSPENFARLLAGPKASGTLVPLPVPGAPRVDWVIDNAALGGFLKGFRGRNCALLSCDDCGYCARTAARAVRTDPALARRAVAACRSALDRFRDGPSR